MPPDKARHTTFFVTDIEADGLDPARNSMLSFARVAVDIRSGILGTFERNLCSRADRAPDARTMAWWASEPDAYNASTKGPVPPEAATKDFAAWVESSPPRAPSRRVHCSSTECGSMYT